MLGLVQLGLGIRVAYIVQVLTAGPTENCFLQVWNSAQCLFVMQTCLEEVRLVADEGWRTVQ